LKQILRELRNEWERDGVPGVKFRASNVQDDKHHGAVLRATMGWTGLMSYDEKQKNWDNFCSKSTYGLSIGAVSSPATAHEYLKMREIKGMVTRHVAAPKPIFEMTKDRSGDPLLKLARSCYHGWKDKWAHLDHALQQISDFNNGDMSLIAGLYFSACAGAGPRTGRREFEIEWDTREELGKLFGKAIKVCTLSKTYAATLADQAYQAVAAGWDQKWQLIEFASSQAHLMNPQDKKRLAEIFQKSYDGGWHTGTLCNQKIGPFLR